MTNFETLNFFRDPEAVADPFGYWDYLRGSGPVVREPHHNVYMVTGYDEAITVYNDANFSSCIATVGPFAGFTPVEQGDDVSDLIEATRPTLPFNDQLPTMDPPMHKQHRGLLMRLLTPKRLKENEDFMWGRADRQIDEFLARGKVEANREFAGPFSLYVIADLLGVPESDHEMFRAELQGAARAERQVGATENDTPEHAPLEFLYDRFTAYIEDRRREPRADVMTEMASATFDDGSIPEVIDVVRVAANIFSAGQETTVRLITSSLLLIADRPELQQRLREDRELIANFIEEVLRYESPVKGDFRMARTTTTLAGVDIPAGAIVMVLNGAANRDQRHFAEPGSFHVDRAEARQHLAFGRGVHTCPGAPLARAEARSCVERFLARTTDIWLSDAAHGPSGRRNFDYAPTFILRGVNELHLEFDPVG